MTMRRWRIALAVGVLGIGIWIVVNPGLWLARERCREQRQYSLSRRPTGHVYTNFCDQRLTQEKVDWVHPVGTLNP